MQQFAREKGTWRWGLLCLAFLAPFFFLTYGFANRYAAGLDHVPSIVFDWEKHIPLWPWSIVPYWSIDLFYGLSLLLCWNKFELKQHVLRLCSAQLISIACFLLWPLKFSVERPALEGFFGLWFDLLMGFDLPFNQAPSLHIVLLVILWDFYRRHSQGVVRYFVDLWSVLIGISILTTWQHHFIDLPTGLMVGGLCIWLFPMSVRSPFQKDQLQRLTPQHLKLGMYYLLAALILSGIAYVAQGLSLWLLYPALSLLIVSVAYLTVRPHFFQKMPNGQMTAGAWLLLAPYLGCGWLNSRLWTRQNPEDSPIFATDQYEIFLGRIPSRQHLHAYHGLFDCCAELPVFIKPQHYLCPQHNYDFYGSLDLVPLQANQLQEALNRFNQFLQRIDTPQQSPTKTLIFCALGYSRSSAILCAWLIQQQHCSHVNDAIELIKKSRPWVVLKEEQIQQIHLYTLKLKGLSP